MGRDLIDRQVAIDALNNILANYVPYLHGLTECIPLDCAVAIKTLPSAQPEIIACGSGELVQEPDDLVEVLVKDCISRSQALNAINVGGDLEGAWRNVAKLPSLSQNVHVPIKDADCISRQQAIDAVVSAIIDGADAELVEGVMEQLPSAQPEIIRCKECKYYTMINAKCEIRGKGLYLIRGMNDFCSRAERRSDE